MIIKAWLLLPWWWKFDRRSSSLFQCCGRCPSFQHHCRDRWWDIERINTAVVFGIGSWELGLSRWKTSGIAFDICCDCKCFWATIFDIFHAITTFKWTVTPNISKETNRANQCKKWWKEKNFDFDKFYDQELEITVLKRILSLESGQRNDIDICLFIAFPER